MLHPDELKVEKQAEETKNPPQPIDVPSDYCTIQRMLKDITEKPDDMTGDKEKRQFNTMLSIMTRIIRNREEGKIEADLPMRDRDPPPEPTGPVTEDHIKLKKAQLGIEALASKFDGEKEKAIFLGTRGALAKLVAAKVPSSCEVEPVKSFEEANQLLKSLTKDFIGEQKDQNKITSATQMLSGYINKLHRENSKSFYPPTVGKHRFGGGFRGSRGGRGGGRGRGGGFRGRGRGGFRGGRGGGFRGGRGDRGRGRGGRGRGRGRGGNFGGSRRGSGGGAGYNTQAQESKFAGPRGGSSNRGRYENNPYGGGHNSNPYGGHSNNQKAGAYGGHGAQTQSYGNENYGSSHNNNSYGGAYGGGHSNHDNTHSNDWH